MCPEWLVLGGAVQDKGEAVTVASLSQITTSLNALTNDDPEMDHGVADDLLLAAVIILGADEVAQAYIDARAKGWWYA